MASETASKKQVDELIALYDTGQLQHVLEHGSQLLEQYPGAVVVYKVLAATYLDLGQLDEAVANYTKVTQLEPDNAIAHSNLGAVLQKLGNIEDAIANYRMALAINPADIESMSNLASALNEAGQLDDACEVLLKAISIKPDYADAYYNLGLAQKELGENEEAVESFHKVLKLQPNYVEALNNLGAVLGVLGQYKEALSSLEEALQKKPRSPEVHTNIGKTLRKSGRIDEAIESFNKAIQLRPDNATGYANLGSALSEVGRYDEAIDCHQQALNLEPDLASAHCGIGVAYNGLGKLDDAITSLKKALDFEPGHASAYSGLGAAFGELGKRKEAIANYEKAVELDPGLGATHYALSRFKKYSNNDPHIDQLKVLLKDESDTSESGMFLNYALAKAYEDVGSVKESFDCLVRANKVQKTNTVYEFSQDRELFDRIKSCFQNYSVGNVPPLQGKENDKQPIFILGMPRSGTTLVEQIIASHSAVFGAGELNTLSQVLVPMVMGDREDGEELIEDNLHLIRSTYLESLERFGVSEPVITDKLPLNFRWIGFIAAAFPDAKIINLIRDPMAICWSIYRIAFNSNVHGYSNDMTELAEYYKLYEDLMAFWREKFPGLIYDLDYQSLTENQKEETRKLLEFCGLDWEEACLNFHETDRVVQTASSVQVRSQIYQGSSRDWEKFKNHLGPLMEALQYHDDEPKEVNSTLSKIRNWFS